MSWRGPLSMQNAQMSRVQVFQAVIPTYSLPRDPPTQRIEAREALMAQGGKIAVILEFTEKMISKKTTEFFVSDKLSLADLHVFHFVSFWSSGCGIQTAQILSGLAHSARFLHKPQRTLRPCADACACSVAIRQKRQCPLT
jgi:glutathione S-transferase